MDIPEQMSIECANCGGTEFVLPEEMVDSSLIECNSCGFSTTLADLREHGLVAAQDIVVEAARRELEDALRKFGK